jgi:hypothetical protein
VNAWQLSFRSNDSHDRPELAVTTLVVPQLPWWYGGSRPVVSYQAAEDSTGTSCAPSYQLATGTDSQTPPQAGAYLAAGYAVAIPDHEGPKAAYLAGPQAGHVVLDGIRAVRSFAKGGVTGASKVALDGYSGGAHATGWAAQLQPSYAPEVKLAGAAFGGLPADPAAVGRYIDGGFAAGFEFAAAFGVSQEYPEAGIEGILNAKGKAAFAAIDGACQFDLLLKFAFQKLADHSTVADPLSYPSVDAVMKAITLGDTAPTTPIYSYHANTDEIVPVGQHNTLVKAWCAKGATVKVDRDLLGEHVEGAVSRLPRAVAWIAARFSGLAATNNC